MNTLALKLPILRFVYLINAMCRQSDRERRRELSHFERRQALKTAQREAVLSGRSVRSVIEDEVEPEPTACAKYENLKWRTYRRQINKQVQTDLRPHDAKSVVTLWNARSRRHLQVFEEEEKNLLKKDSDLSDVSTKRRATTTRMTSD